MFFFQSKIGKLNSVLLKSFIKDLDSTQPISTGRQKLGQSKKKKNKTITLSAITASASAHTGVLD